MSTDRSPPLALGIALTLTLAVGCDAQEQPHENAPQRPDIVLITVDTLRADHLGAYGYPLDTSPHFDALAAESLRFERAYAQAAETCPSLASLFTSYLPHENQVTTNLVALPSSVETLVESLAASGYATAAVVSNYVLRAESQFDQGFDEYNDDLSDVEATRGAPERIASATVDAALEWLARPQPQSRFLWVHFQDPHGPYTPPPPYDERFANASQYPRQTLALNQDDEGGYGIPAYQQLGGQNELAYYLARYDGEIRYFDDQLGRLLEGLRDLGVYEDALIVVAADHGEALGEHDVYFSHGGTPFEHVLRVPLLVRWNGRSGVVSEPVALLDVPRTILGVAQLDVAEARRGRSLLEEPVSGRAIFSETRAYRTLLVDRLSLTIKRDEEFRLYDVVADPGQLENLVHTAPRATVLEMREKLVALDSDDRLGIVEVPLEMHEDTLEKLRGLGYAR